MGDNEQADRFAYVLDFAFGGDQTAFAAALGCSQSLVSRIVRKVQGPGQRLIKTFASLPGIDVEWARLGKVHLPPSSPNKTLLAGPCRPLTRCI